MTRLLAALSLALLSLLSLTAHAADRPYIVANSGAAEEDEEQVWSVENWVRQRPGGRRASPSRPEYAFSPDNSLQVEFRRVVDRDNGNGHEIEIEFKHLFNRIAREGWGWGAWCWRWTWSGPRAALDARRHLAEPAAHAAARRGEREPPAPQPRRRQAQGKSAASSPA